MNVAADTAPAPHMRRPLTERQSVVGVSQVLLLVGIFAIWEFAVVAGWMDSNRGGQPSEMWRFFVLSVASGEMWTHLKVTLYEEIVGFAIGMGGGTLVGLGLWWSRTLTRILEPFAVVFNGIPKIALAPPMIVWFGIYETSKIVLAATICFVVAWLSA